MSGKKYDFSGWATKNDLKCADGRVIKQNAFKINDGMTVPLVWNHRHDVTSAVLGHALLENRDEGVYAYGSFNNTQAGKEAKEMVRHGDVVSLSIYANNLVQEGANVLHGAIREVSLVLAGANPGAFIESAMSHGEPIDEFDEEGVFYTGYGLELSHSDDKKKYDDEEDEDEEYDEEDSEDSEDEEDVEEEDEENEKPKKKKEDKEMAHSDDNGGEKTIQEIVDTMNEDQKNAMYALIGAAVEDAEGGSDNDDEEDEDMKHNVFDTDDQMGNYISHADMEQIFRDAKRLGSLRDAVNENIESGVLAHSLDTTGMVGPSPDTARQTYGFRDPDMLFPEYKSLNTPPEWIKRDTGWVSVLMAGIHHSPFSRIKSQFADITEDEARAKGYIKAHQKKDEVFTLLKRTTDPQTVYKRQKMDRDDIIDITDFDVVAWIKAEMRVMLDEEIARAILIGDGRNSDSDDKIQEAHIRPIINDVPLFNTKCAVKVSNGATAEAKAKEFIDTVIRSRKYYKGSGNPILFTTEDQLTEMLLIKDQMGHYMYESVDALATRLRVSRIVTVEVMEGQKVSVDVPVGTGTQTVQKDLLGVIVNPADYNVGADKGGSIELFDDFDIDYNQFKYLIETRISGALTKPFSALTVYLDEAVAG